MLLSSCFIHIWISSENKFWIRIKGTIKEEWKYLGSLIVVLSLLIISVGFIELFFDPPSVLIVILILVMFIISSLFQIVKQFKQRTVKEDRDKKNEQGIFGIQTKKKVTQWFDLIVMYYELFFHEVTYKALPKLEAYQLVINGVYTYQLIDQYFVKKHRKYKRG